MNLARFPNLRRPTLFLLPLLFVAEGHFGYMAICILRLSARCAVYVTVPPDVITVTAGRFRSLPLCR